MHAYRPDRVVRVLTTIVSIMYFATLAGGVILLVSAPLWKILAPDNPDWVFGLRVPVTLTETAGTVRSPWGVWSLELEHLYGKLEVPVALAPWWLVAVLWTYVAVLGALMLLALHNLRRVFQRARAGAPFDAQNALRLRRIGLLLIAFAVFNGICETIWTRVVRSWPVSGDLRVATGGLQLDATLIFVGLALVALAEIFRRGTELEVEQSLVV